MILKQLAVGFLTGRLERLVVDVLLHLVADRFRCLASLPRLLHRVLAVGHLDAGLLRSPPGLMNGQRPERPERAQPLSAED